MADNIQSVSDAQLLTIAEQVGGALSKNAADYPMITAGSTNSNLDSIHSRLRRSICGKAVLFR